MSRTQTQREDRRLSVQRREPEPEPVRSREECIKAFELILAKGVRRYLQRQVEEARKVAGAS